mgnify:CR=1 FL=1
MNNEVLLANIRNLCKNKGVAIVTLEKHLGIGAGTISRWNKANPSFDKIMAIADYFQVSIDELAGRSVEKRTEHVDETTERIIQYLLRESKDEKNAGFWHDYEDETPEAEFMLEKLAYRRNNGKLFYACDEDGYYLLEVCYQMDANFDYKTYLKLYLMPDERTEPVLECESVYALRELYVYIMNEVQSREREKTSREKVKRQKEQILKKIHEMNLEDEI